MAQCSKKMHLVWTFAFSSSSYLGRKTIAGIVATHQQSKRKPQKITTQKNSTQVNLSLSDELTHCHNRPARNFLPAPPVDHREPEDVEGYEGAVHLSSSMLRHMFTDLIDSFLICRISD